MACSQYANPETEEIEPAFTSEKNITVQAVDNLPCELPIDASEDFGNELIKEVFDALFIEDASGMIEKGSETNLKGELMPNYKYLEDYVAGK